jgi:simple sugar transport system ATP-binding protein
MTGAAAIQGIAHMSVLSVRSVSKRFGNIQANDNISFDLKKGSIHAFLGENGAGKTTLMNILYGLYRADSGDVLRNGEIANIDSPRDAIALGIGMVHQHFMLVPAFTVAENIVLGQRSKTGIRLDDARLYTLVGDFFRSHGADIDMRKKVADLPVGIQQRVEIFKALFHGAEILILDEPTAVLTPQETAELFVIMRKLKDEGKSIIFITHKLNEVLSVCDTVTVLRSGRIAGEFDASETEEDELCEAMIGRRIIDHPKVSVSVGGPVLELDGLSVCSNIEGQIACHSIDLAVHAGEIVGVAGVDGNGQTELAEALTGLRKVEGGTIRINGKDITNQNPRKVALAGVGHVPEDRQAMGLVMDLSLLENCILQSHQDPPISRHGFLNREMMIGITEKMIEEYRIKCDGFGNPVSSLSGGNQQKVILAREMFKDPDAYVISKPTRGLDVGAIENIHRILLEEKKRGKAILLFSTELEEIYALSDRIAVMYGGTITGLLWPDEPVELVGALMAGTKRDVFDAERGIAG